MKTRDKCIEICGDGVDLQFYPCDDGNTVDGDGCSSCCKVEFGYVCTGGTKTCPDKCYDKCGDGYVVLRPDSKYCDDGDKFGGDGCSATCQVETGFQCSGGSPTGPDVCTEICGDGLDMGFVECDDGNTKDGDGCSSTCEIEVGWTCEGGSKSGPDFCKDICGDGHVWYRATADYCDDGNNSPGDGCSPTCHIEPGFACSGGDSTHADQCHEICGDCKNMGANECDDGNTVDGDGCSSTC